jgi:hypothetical protein
LVMNKTKKSRPMNVFVRPGSKAELACRRYAAKQKVPPKSALPRSEVLAQGFKPQKALNLHDHGGKIITGLTYTNFFVGGNAWDPQDIQQINQHLAKAMSDQQLNNGLIQYFRGAANIATTFRPSQAMPNEQLGTVSQQDVENRLTQISGTRRLGWFRPIQHGLQFHVAPRGSAHHRRRFGR